MTPFLEHRGIEVIRTSRRRIQQLDGQPPSHIVFPAIHKTRQDVAQVFARAIGTDPNNDHAALEVCAGNNASQVSGCRCGHDGRQLRHCRNRDLHGLYQ